MAVLGIIPAQCRAARALLDWSREQLAAASSVGVRTIIDFESGARVPRAVTTQALCRALEETGIIFLDGNGEGAGVRLRKGSGSGTIAADELNASNDE